MLGLAALPAAVQLAGFMFLVRRWGVHASDRPRISTVDQEVDILIHYQSVCVFLVRRVTLSITTNTNPTHMYAHSIHKPKQNITHLLI